MSLMNVFGLSELKRSNKKLHNELGVERGEQVDIKFVDGFFICPDDEENRKKNLPHKVILNINLVEFILNHFKDIAECISLLKDYMGQSKNSLVPNFFYLKKTFKLIFFFAGAYHIYSCNKQVGSIKSAIYKGDKAKELQKKIVNNFKCFLDLAIKKEISRNYKSLFDFAKYLIQEKIPQVKFKKHFRDFRSFVRFEGYNPLKNWLGDEWEPKIEEDFTEEDSEKLDKLFKKEFDAFRLIRKLVKTKKGVLIAFDREEIIERKPEGVKCPDYLYVTKKQIRPIDMKCTLKYAKPQQVSAENMREFFERAPSIFQDIFYGLTIEGKFMESSREDSKIERKEEESFDPQQVLSECGVDSRKDLKIISELWNEWKDKWQDKVPITQKILRERGIKHSNLGLIMKVFNEMLNNKK